MKKHDEKINELTMDLQRVRADFENYRKRMDADKAAFGEITKAATIMKLLPVIDNIERAVNHAPTELKDNAWIQGVVGLGKNLGKAIAELGLSKINATPGTLFDPNLHEAVTAEGEGEHEVITDELRPGYMLNGQIIRPSLVKVTKQNSGENSIEVKDTTPENP